MRVTIITNIPSPYRAALFDYLHENDLNDYNIIYYANERKELNWNKDLIHNADFVKSCSLNYKTKLYLKTISIPNIFNFVSILKKNKPDIIVASEYNISSLISFLYSKIMRIKYIQWSDATIYSERNYTSIKKIIRKIICKRSDRYIASSTETKELLISYGAREQDIYVSLIAPVPLQMPRIISNKKEYVNIEALSVGFFSTRKGYDLLIQSIVGIEKLHKLHIVGDGEKMDEVKVLIKNLNLSEKVILHGRKTQEEIYSLMSKVHFFIHPSREDCFGLVVLEAMENGLPILVSKYTGCKKDLVLNGINGFIYDPINIDDSKMTIEQLIDDASLLDEMGKQSKLIAERYTLPKVAIEYINAINSVISYKNKMEGNNNNG